MSGQRTPPPMLSAEQYDMIWDKAADQDRDRQSSCPPPNFGGGASPITPAVTLMLSRAVRCSCSSNSSASPSARIRASDVHALLLVHCVAGVFAWRRSSSRYRHGTSARLSSSPCALAGRRASEGSFFLGTVWGRCTMPTPMGYGEKC